MRRRSNRCGAAMSANAGKRAALTLIVSRRLTVERLESRAMLSAVSFTGSYSQDFDALPTGGTSFFYGGLTNLDARPISAAGMTGWQLQKVAGQGDFTTFIADGGSSATSSMRSFGATGSTERALGSLADQLGSYAFGVTLTNDTGGTLTSFTLSFAGEQWRESGALAAQVLRFEYAIGAGASLAQGTFATAPALDFSSLHYGSVARALDGNDAANRTSITATISGITWSPGEELALRWTDADDANADHGLGIDDLTLTALPLNLSPPVFTAGAAQTFAVAENSPSGAVVGVAAATDADSPVEPLIYSIVAGAPMGAFAVDANGQLTIADAGLLDLDFDDGEQVAVLTVQVSDGLHTAEQTVTVNVLPLNDHPPQFTAGATQTLSLDENSLSGAIVGQAAATDADVPAETLLYSIMDGNALGAFAIDSNGQLTIVDATLLDLDFENGEQVAVLTVQASDGVNAATQIVTVNVLPANDHAPQFLAGGAQTLAIDENAPTGTVIGQATAADADLPVEPLSYSIIDGDPTGAFAIDASGQLTIADATLLDLDFENGEQVALLTVQVTDGVNATTQSVTVNVLSQNDNPPAFVAGAYQTLSIDENSPTGAILGQAAATDADLPAETLTYTIIDGDPTNAFAIDANGQLTIADAALLDLDYENGEQVAVLTVQVSDGANSVTQAVTVNVLPLNDNLPQFMAGAAQTLSIDENSSSGAIVGQANATDGDLPAETLAYSIVDGDALGAFAIDANGKLTIVDSALLDLDYENGEQVAVLTVQVSDGANSVTQSVTVNVLPLNDNSPAFVAGASQTLSIDENSPTGTIVGQTAATDGDLPLEALTYSIIDGDPTSAFAIDASGQLTIVDATLLDLDFEHGEQVAVLTVHVTDGANMATQSVTVNVLPLNDNLPVFSTAATLAVEENVVNVVALAAVDADLPSQTIAFSIVGGADAGFFTIVNGNELKLLAGLDYESPTDFDADGVYLAEVQADDGQGGITTLPLSITVTDVDETPPPLMALGGATSTWWITSAVMAPQFLTAPVAQLSQDEYDAAFGELASVVEPAAPAPVAIGVMPTNLNDDDLSTDQIDSVDKFFSDVEAFADGVESALFA